MRDVALSSLHSGQVASLHSGVALEFVRAGGLSDTADGSWTWVHLARDHPETAGWLAQVTGISDTAREGLLSDDSRPRCAPLLGHSLLLRLRGLHRNNQSVCEASQDRHLGYAITLLVQPSKVLSTAEVSLEAVRHARELLCEHPRPSGADAHVYPTPGAFVAQLVELLMEDALRVVAGLQDDLDAFEERDEESGGTAEPSLVDSETAMALLAAHRRTAVKLRRWVGPQREALRDMVLKGASWLCAPQDEAAKLRLRGAMDATAQLLESLDAIREHALVLKEELASAEQRRANAALSLLAVVSALFLPFSFVTGLLSMSVGGIPGQRDDRAFWCVTAGCVALLLLGCALFKRLRWL